MILYHGSNQEIKSIDLSKGKMYKDFGRGFYATDILDQAMFWSKRISERYGGTATVSEFEFDMGKALADGLNIKIFEDPNSEWALFVMANRSEKGIPYHHDYDIVIGPVADDKMARLFGLYDLEVIDLDAVVAGLKYKGLNSQYFFASQRSLKYIKPISMC